MRHFPPGVAVVLAVLWAACLIPDAGAAQAKDYAYLFLQGRVSDPSGRKPLAKVNVRLSATSGTFETETDARGVFIFDRLPIASYDLEVVTHDGRVIRRARRIEVGDLDRTRLEVRMGRGSSESLRLEAVEGGVEAVVPEPSPNWGRLWKQSLVFVGGALILVLAL